MATKPQYSRILTSREFRNRADAETFGKKQRAEYKDAGESVKYDVTRTEQGYWEATVYLKV